MSIDLHKFVDLKWDENQLDIEMEENQIEPKIIRGLPVVEQMIGIAILSSQYCLNLINCEPNRINRNLKYLEEEIYKEFVKFIKVGSLKFRYSFEEKSLIGECTITDINNNDFKLNFDKTINNG